MIKLCYTALSYVVGTTQYRVILHGTQYSMAMYRIYHTISFEEIIISQNAWMQKIPMTVLQ